MIISPIIIGTHKKRGRMLDLFFYVVAVVLDESVHLFDKSGFGL